MRMSGLFYSKKKSPIIDPKTHDNTPEKTETMHSYSNIKYVRQMFKLCVMPSKLNKARAKKI